MLKDINYHLICGLIILILSGIIYRLSTNQGKLISEEYYGICNIKCYNSDKFNCKCPTSCKNKCSVKWI